MMIGDIMADEDLELKELNSFTGTEHYYNVMGALVTDGVKYIMDNGYSWFVTDALAVIKTKFRNKEFLSIKLQVNKEKQDATMLITDGNDNVLYKQYYKYTNAKIDLTLFFTDNVLLLSNEYWGDKIWMKKRKKLLNILQRF